MVDENNLQEVELLTKRFRDYIDKVQIMLEKAATTLPEMAEKHEPDGSEKLYTVITPADAMAVNLQSVLTTLESAIRNIEEISGVPSEKPATYQVETADVPTAEGRGICSGTEKQLFSIEELKFLEKTFNKILNASVKERSQIFESLAKTGDSDTG